MKESKKASDAENKNENGAEGDLFEGVLRDVMEVKSKSRLWSVISMFLAVVSLSLCLLVYWLGIIFGVASILAIFISRKSLGYFDRISVFSLIIAIFGTIFSLLLLIASLIISGNEELMHIFSWVI